MANNRIAANFLIVAEEGTNPRAISGRTRSAGSTAMSAQFTISDAGGDKRNPDVGGDPYPGGPTYYCVVWERVETWLFDHDVHAQLVQSDGTMQGGPILIDNSGFTVDQFPAISNSNGNGPYQSQRWTVVWQRNVLPNVASIFGSQLTWDGTIAEATFPIAHTAPFENHEHPNRLDHPRPRFERQPRVSRGL